MRKIFVEPEQILSCAARMENTNQDYLREINEFFTVVENMATSWQGKDNLTFTNRISKFDGDFKQLSLLCTQYIEFLRNSSHAYREVQDELVNQASQLTQ